MRVLLTGANGFLGRNFAVALMERDIETLPFTRETPIAELTALVQSADVVIHLAGANRPREASGFQLDNHEFTSALADALRQAGGNRRHILFASSTQAESDNDYGRSKRAAEDALAAIADIADITVYRLPNVFGKWSRPFYNSAVATFCHQAAHGLPLSVNDPASKLDLVYVDDVVAEFLSAMEAPQQGLRQRVVTPVYNSSVGEVSSLIEGMAKDREALGVDRVGRGLARALYATFLAFLPADRFSYPIPQYGDARGRFVEAVKTRDSGQVSYFTQVPGVERGGHYHHSKSEKFLVVRGKARFRFRHMITGERVDFDCSAEEPRIVDTIPGWAHDVVNLTEDELVVIIWANEVFDRDKPDTIQEQVIQ